MSGPPAGNWQMIFNSNGSAWDGYVNSLWGGQNGTTPANVAYSPQGITLTATAAAMGGELSTVGSTTGSQLSFEYGYIQATIKMPAGNAQGMWGSFWMLPTPDPNDHNGDGEIDITEIIDGQNTDYVHLHHEGFVTAGLAYNPGVSLSAGYHTYGVDWEPNSMTWYFDGTPVFNVTGAIVPATPEYVILSLWDDGGWPGDTTAATLYPNTMQIQSIQAWQHTANSQPLPGDLNGDGVVDSSDFSILDNELSQGQISPAAFNTDLAAMTATYDSEDWTGPLLTMGTPPAIPSIETVVDEQIAIIGGNGSLSAPLMQAKPAEIIAPPSIQPPASKPARTPKPLETVTATVQNPSWLDAPASKKKHGEPLEAVQASLESWLLWKKDLADAGAA